MERNYKLTSKQTEALKFLKRYEGEVSQEIADKNIHWRTQHSLYVKLLTSNWANGKGGIMRLNKRGYAALNFNPS